MNIRPFAPTDVDACLELFVSNVPKYFDMKDFEAFKTYLIHHDDGNLVIEDEDGEIIACGGYWVKGDTGRLSYGMVGKAYHGKGIGTLLLKERLTELSKRCEKVEIDTSQETEGFYARFGFKTIEVSKEAHGEGLDSVIMQLTLSE